MTLTSPPFKAIGHQIFCNHSTESREAGAIAQVNFSIPSNRRLPELSEADKLAAFIVTACNLHEELVEALKKMAAFRAEIPPSIHDDKACSDHLIRGIEADDAIAEVLAKL